MKNFEHTYGRKHDHPSGISGISDEISWLSLEFSCKTPREEEFGLLEFEKKLTHIFSGSGVSIIRSTRGSFGRNEKRERREKRKKESKGRNSKEVFPRNFHIGNSYFNSG